MYYTRLGAHDDYTVLLNSLISYYKICCNFPLQLNKAGSEFSTGICHIENKFELPKRSGVPVYYFITYTTCKR